MKMKVELFSYTIKNHQFLGHINVRPIFVPRLTGRYIFINQSQKGFTGNLFGFYWQNTVVYWKRKYFLLEKNYMNLFSIYWKKCDFLPDGLFIAIWKTLYLIEN